MQGGKDLFIGKIARDAKEYQRVRMSSHPGWKINTKSSNWVAYIFRFDLSLYQI
jgi:hypothetical protein